MSLSRTGVQPLPKATSTDDAVDLHPITRDDLHEVAQFLHDELDARVPVESWASQINPTWAVDQPNHGFLLRRQGRVVGAYLAYYSDRQIGGATECFCNLAAWCVAGPYRSHAIRLLRALMRQRGYHFTDLSPSTTVQSLNSRLGFVPLDTSTVVVPNLPWPVVPRDIEVFSDDQTIRRVLGGRQLEIYLDHRGAAAAHHVVIARGAQTCHVIFRRVRRKNLALFASLVYVGNRELFRAGIRQFCRHLLLRHGIPATLIESHVAEVSCTGAFSVSDRPKMYHSDSLRPDQIDFLYSELTCMRW
ncbi:hypothetical protein [Mycolicibacterium fluoranthenivorans]|uniref:N-acetyltransferase domain-containing protein n=1 Tax=Mycolicibacterium fluoranthenivorans TaxID=258505 RepID=A0A1G4VJD3_9MYCO|nr:hypothetical protein [Mycolicibacterium fluoranthenivorans]SCX07157.1 hypothetical protein SAMN02799620_00980 [Mycolicibacterium fluoranthenivorans]